MSVIISWLESLHFEMKITSRCSRSLSSRSTCTQCFETCKLDAIVIHEGAIRLNPERCNGCGECAISCPLSAIEGIPAGRKFEKNSLAYDPLFTPSIKELLIYKKRNITSILLGPDVLEVNSEWSQALADTNEVLLQLSEEPLTIVKKEESVISRRELFHNARAKGQKLAKDLAPARWKAAGDDWLLAKFYQEHQFYEVAIDTDKCILCRACFALCPQYVLSITTSSLTIENYKCVNCGLCEDVCSEDALSIRKKAAEKQENTLKVFEKRCQECGQAFYSFQPEKQNCLVCSDRDSTWLKP